MSYQLTKNKQAYHIMKFKYLCLKMEGGYIDTNPTQIAAAAIAVINCANKSNDQLNDQSNNQQSKSVDCNTPIVVQIQINKTIENILIYALDKKNKLITSLSEEKIKLKKLKDHKITLINTGLSLNFEEIDLNKKKIDVNLQKSNFKNNTKIELENQLKQLNDFQQSVQTQNDKIGKIEFNIKIIDDKMREIEIIKNAIYKSYICKLDFFVDLITQPDISTQLDELKSRRRNLQRLIIECIKNDTCDDNMANLKQLETDYNKILKTLLERVINPLNIELNNLQIIKRDLSQDNRIRQIQSSLDILNKFDLEVQLDELKSEHISESVKMSKIEKIKKITDLENKLSSANIKFNAQNAKNEKLLHIDITNRECDSTGILPTVASIYLSILAKIQIENNSLSILEQTINDLIIKKLLNCSSTQLTSERVQNVIYYYFKVLNKINLYLSEIGTPNHPSYEDILLNAEYGKYDSSFIENITKAQPNDVKTSEKIVIINDNETPNQDCFLSVKKTDLNKFRIVNEFIGANLDKINLIDISKFKIPNQKYQISEVLQTVASKFQPIETTFNINNFVIFGIVKDTNKIVSNTQKTFSNIKSNKIVNKFINDYFMKNSIKREETIKNQAYKMENEINQRTLQYIN